VLRPVLFELSTEPIELAKHFSCGEQRIVRR